MTDRQPNNQPRRWKLLIGCSVVAVLLLAAFLVLNVIGLTI